MMEACYVYFYIYAQMSLVVFSLNKIKTMQTWMKIGIHFNQSQHSFHTNQTVIQRCHYRPAMQCDYLQYSKSRVSKMA